MSPGFSVDKFAAGYIYIYVYICKLVSLYSSPFISICLGHSELLESVYLLLLIT